MSSRILVDTGPLIATLAKSPLSCCFCEKSFFREVTT